MQTRRFYHSFPRPRRADTDQTIVAKGLGILQLMATTGVILAPEVVQWRQPLIDGTHRTTDLLQTRACFTELAAEELPEHGKRFGPFALEFDLATLRRAGALPVIYMPQTTGGDRNFSVLGLGIVTQLGDIKYTIEQLHHLQNISSSEWLLQYAKDQGATSVSEDCVINLTNVDENGNAVNVYRVPRKYVEQILSYIGFKNAPFDFMRGVLSLMQALFYPTDDQKHDQALAYYRQREWRLVGDIAINGVPVDRPLVDAEKEQLLRIDAHFWGGELRTKDNVHRRVDLARALTQSVDGQPLFGLAEKILVPTSAYDQATSICGDKVSVVAP
jgi:hypothetical protein